MATGSPPLADTTIVAKLQNDWTWLTTHIILLVFVVGLAFAGVYGVEYIVAKHDDANSAKLNAVAAQLAQSNQQTQQATQQQISQLAQQSAALQAQVQALLQQNSQRNSNLAAQQGTDQTLPPTQLAQRWDALLGTLNQVSTTPTGFGVTPQAAVDTVTQLESVPVLAADNKNLQSAVDNQTMQIANDKTSLDASAKALDSEKASHTADNTSAAANLASCKADANKSKLKWFGIGVVVGYIGRIITVK